MLHAASGFQGQSASITGLAVVVVNVLEGMPAAVTATLVGVWMILEAGGGFKWSSKCQLRYSSHVHKANYVVQKVTGMFFYNFFPVRQLGRG